MPDPPDTHDPQDSQNPPESTFVDWHCHSKWSDGGAWVPELLEQARTRGVTLGISDHGLMDNARLRTAGQIAVYMEDLARHDVLKGLEISVGEDAVADGLLDQLDYVIASLHTVRAPEGIVSAVRYLNYRAGLYPGYKPSVARFDREAYFDVLLSSMEETFRRWPIRILGHFCLQPECVSADAQFVLDQEPEPDDLAAEWLDEVIRLCVRSGVAIEINSKSRVPHPGMVRRALALGARFSLGSDAHQLRRAGDLSYGVRLMGELGIPAERVLSAKDIKGAA